jgi:hypothetical protein
LPSGAAGKSYIRETTRLINYWNNNSKALKNTALKAVMIMPHLLLQKPRPSLKNMLLVFPDVYFCGRLVSLIN